MAQRPHNPTDLHRRTVQRLAALGLPIEQIASVLAEDGKKKLRRDSIYKYYEQEMRLGKAQANAQVAKSLFNKAINGDTAAAIFWCKTQMGWKEKSVHEVSGIDGEPMQFATIKRVIVKNDGGKEKK